MKELIELNKKLVGWCSVSKAITLFNLVVAHRPTVILEVGVFGGSSAIPMMMACKLNGRGIVHCVDPWSHQASLDGQVTTVDKQWWGDLNHEAIYEGFIGHVKNQGLEKQCKIHRMKSSEFDAPSRIDIFHCDGNHGPDAVEDTMKFASKVDHGGYVILDDLNWSQGYVQKSAEWLKATGFIELHPLGTGALYYRI